MPEPPVDGYFHNRVAGTEPWKEAQTVFTANYHRKEGQGADSETKDSPCLVNILQAWSPFPESTYRLVILIATAEMPPEKSSFTLCR